MATTSSLRVSAASSGAPIVVSADDLKRMTNSELAHVHKRHRADSATLMKLRTELLTRKKPLATATLALVNADLKTVGRSSSPISRKSWKAISFAAVLGAVVLGFAHGAGGQLWATAWPIIESYLRSLISVVRSLS